MTRKRRRWGIHIDHPWSECAKWGAPFRVYITTPWVFIQTGVKSQRYWKGKYSPSKWDYISFRPLNGDNDIVWHLFEILDD